MKLFYVLYKSFKLCIDLKNKNYELLYEIFEFNLNLCSVENI